MKINTETLTKAICNKGFSGNSSILPRIKFRVTLQEVACNPLLHIASTVMLHFSQFFIEYKKRLLIFDVSIEWHYYDPIIW